MKFWIVTPSYNQVEWLKLCVASVADQAGDGFEVHHHVQDACSKDGTVDFLREYESKIRALGAGYLASEQNAEREGSGPKAQSLPIRLFIQLCLRKG